MKIDGLTKEALKAHAEVAFEGAVAAFLMRLPEIAENIEEIAAGRKRLSLKIDSLCEDDGLRQVTFVDFVVRDADTPLARPAADEAV